MVSRELSALSRRDICGACPGSYWSAKHKPYSTHHSARLLSRHDERVYDCSVYRLGMDCHEVGIACGSAQIIAA